MTYGGILDLAIEGTPDVTEADERLDAPDAGRVGGVVDTTSTCSCGTRSVGCRTRAWSGTMA